MNTRIKFKYDSKKLKEATYGMSKQTFRSNEKDYRLFVHFKDLYFEILDVNGNVVLKGGKTKNRAVLLRQAKRALIEMGCAFNDETRDRGNQSQSTGSN